MNHEKTRKNVTKAHKNTWKNVIARINNKRGENYIDTVVGVIAAMMVIVVALNVFSFLTLKQDLDYYAKEMVEVCCSYGKTCEEVQDRDEELTAELGISPDLSFDGTEYFNISKRTVQYGEVIVVTVTYQTYVRGLGVFKIPVTLTAKHSGLSRRYWK
jgi:hypothetical protein